MRFDWTYSMSDDNSVYKRGKQGETDLRLKIKNRPEYQKIYNEIRAYAWGRGPMPQRPSEPAFRTGESNNG